MKYLLLIYGSESNWDDMPATESAKMLAEYEQLSSDWSESILSSEALQPVHTATTVRVRDGKTTLTDGPFAETREQLGGFFLIEAKDLDEATRFAAQIPDARLGCVEIRPIQVYDVPPA